jgi:hypothetical protein
VKRTSFLPPGFPQASEAGDRGEIGKPDLFAHFAGDPVAIPIMMAPIAWLTLAGGCDADGSCDFATRKGSHVDRDRQGATACSASDPSRGSRCRPRAAATISLRDRSGGVPWRARIGERPSGSVAAGEPDRPRHQGLPAFAVYGGRLLNLRSFRSASIAEWSAELMALSGRSTVTPHPIGLQWPWSGGEPA